MDTWVTSAPLTNVRSTVTDMMNMQVITLRPRFWFHVYSPWNRTAGLFVLSQGSSEK